MAWSGVNRATREPMNQQDLPPLGSMLKVVRREAWSAVRLCCPTEEFLCAPTFPAEIDRSPT